MELTHRKRRITLLLLAALATYLGFLSWRIGAYAGAADSSGYLNHARLLRDGKIRTATRALPELPAKNVSAYAYIPLGFSPANAGDPSEMVPIYPIGLPLLIVVVSWITGWDAAPHATLLLHATAAVLLMFAVARKAGVSRNWALLGATTLALSPMFLFASVTLLSDMPALVWTTAAVLLAWHSDRRRLLAAAAGAAFAIAVLVRPTNALAIFPIAIALGRDARHWFAFVAGGAPGAAILVAHNYAAYGHPLRSGYGPIWQAFSTSYASDTLIHYATWLPVVLTPLFLLVPGLPAIAGNQPRVIALLGAWAAAFAGFYAFYSFTASAWWYLRFLLPAFPALIVAMFLVADKLAARLAHSLRFPRHAPLVAGVCLVLPWAVPWSYGLHACDIGQNERAYVEATEWARAHLPRNAVIFAMQTTGALYYYTDFAFVHWSYVTPQDVAAIESAAARSGRPVFAMLFPFEEDDVLRKLLPGQWRKEGSARHITIWRRLSGHVP